LSQASRSRFHRGTPFFLSVCEVGVGSRDVFSGFRRHAAALANGQVLLPGLLWWKWEQEAHEAIQFLAVINGIG